MSPSLTLLLLASLLPTGALADESPEQVATVTASQGSVVLLAPLARGEPPPGAALVSYEGRRYAYRAATVGTRVGNGEILRCAPGAKARLVYENGDAVEVFPGTSYRVNWEGGGHPLLQLDFGEVRAIVSSHGPRSRLSVRTRTAVMGVRGTDFTVHEDGERGSEVTVLRGKVAVLVAANGELSVGSGSTARVASDATMLHETTRSELKRIRELSRIEPGPAQQPPPPETRELEARAAATALEDLREKSPELATGIDPAGTPGLEALDDRVIPRRIERAPADARPVEGRFEGPDETEDRAYRRYFDGRKQ